MKYICSRGTEEGIMEELIQRVLDFSDVLALERAFSKIQRDR